MTGFSLKHIQLLLRIAIFLMFLGHGIFAIQGNPGWLIYLKTIGFQMETSKELITVIGYLDILVAIVILLKPIKLVALWAIFWTFSTALIRPLSGEPIWAFIERGANWISPLILYLLIINKKKL